MGDITFIHDTFIRTILADKEVAIDYFRASLPAYVLDRLDFSTLTQLPDTYVSKELRKTVSDIVYSCSLKDGKGEIRISLLIEHKSFLYKYTPIQIGSYIFSGLLKQVANKEKPSLIIPILLYHGKERWEYRTLADLFKDLNPELKQFVPDYEYIYHNLGEISDEQITALHNKFLAASFLALKYSLSNVDPEYWIPTILELAQGIDKNLHSALTIYIFVTSGLEEEGIIMILEKLHETVKKTVMLTWDVLIEKGRKEKTEKAVRNMIHEGLPTDLICKILEVTPDDVARIRGEMENSK